MKQKYDFLIVGTGIFGSVLARVLAEGGKSVLMVEKRIIVGGNISTTSMDGIIVHTYGPHIFHTSDEKVWSFVNRYAEFYPFINSPIANYRGELYHLPFNMNTFHELWGVNTPEEAHKRIDEEVAKESIGEPRNLEEQAIKLVGRTIFEKLIKGYTEKQWGKSCRELPSSIIKRVPLRFAYDNNYYDDKYQGLPKGGYSLLIDSLLAKIEVKTNVDYLANRSYFNSLAGHIVFTGMIDAFFDYSRGKLEYRSLRFDFEKKNCDDFQGNPVVNYTSSDVKYTRITEHKHFDPFCLNHHSTFITYEYPALYEGTNEPYYPINDDKNSDIFAQYATLASGLEPKVFFGGRLASYKYFDMDDSVAAAIKLSEKLLAL